MTIAVNSAANAVAPSSNTRATSKTGFGALGAADFIKLMTAQMRQQDPFKPLDNKDMLAQMAQFTTLSQTNDVSTGIRTMNATLETLGTKLDAILTAQQAAAAANSNNSTPA